MLGDYHRHRWLHLACPARPVACLLWHRDWCRNSATALGNFSRAGQLFGKTLGQSHVPWASHEQAWAMVLKQSWEQSHRKKLNDFQFSQKEKWGSWWCWCSWMHLQQKEGGLGFENMALPLLPWCRGHPWGFRKEGTAEKRAANRVQPLPKHQGPGSEGAPSGNSLSRPMPLQQSEKGNENLSIGKPSRESRFQAYSFILPSLIYCQIFPCILHFSGDSKLYFYIKSKGKNFGHCDMALHC